MSLFGQKVRLLRLQRQVTQSRLAEHLGLSSHSHVAKIEAGQRGVSVTLALFIADFFGVTVAYLLDDEILVDHIQYWNGLHVTEPEQPLRQFGPKLRFLRDHRELSQSDLARKLGLAGQASISNIELSRKTVTSSLLLQLAKALDTSPDYFVRDEATFSSFEELPISEGKGESDK